MMTRLHPTQFTAEQLRDYRRTFVGFHRLTNAIEDERDDLGCVIAYEATGVC